MISPSLNSGSMESPTTRSAKTFRPRAGGAYEAVRDVLAALADKDLGLGIEPLAPVRTSLLFAGKDTAVYAVEFRTAFEGGA